MQLLLLISYPLCVHLAVVTFNANIQLLALILLAAGISYPGIKQKSIFAWMVLLVVILMSLVISYLGLTLYVLYIPPIVIPLLLWSVFFRSLLPGQTPLTTQIGESVHGPFRGAMAVYSRRVTVFWSLFFVLLAIWSGVLVVVASTEVWSLFTNVINYLLVGVVFITEYLYRKFRFREFKHLHFWRYVSLIAKADIRNM